MACLVRLSPSGRLFPSCAESCAGKPTHRTRGRKPRAGVVQRSAKGWGGGQGAVAEGRQRRGKPEDGAKQVLGWMSVQVAHPGQSKDRMRAWSRGRGWGKLLPHQETHIVGSPPGLEDEVLLEPGGSLALEIQGQCLHLVILHVV